MGKFKQSENNVPDEPRLVEASGKARRVLFWAVVAVVVLNIFLVLKFGLSRKAERSVEEIPKTVKPP